MRRTLVSATVLVLAAGLLVPAAAAPLGPSIQIVAPRNGATISGTQMVVEVRVADFILNGPAIGRAGVPGQGHWQAYVDGTLAGLSADDVVSIPNDTYPALGPGRHVIKVELRHNDYTPVAGAKSAEVTVRIPERSPMRYAPAPGSPGIKILSPRNHAKTSPDVIVWVRIQGVKQNPLAIGKAAAPGEGYWRLFADGAVAGLSASSVADVQLARGKHTLRAVLYNNDHTPLRGASSDQIAITVR